MADESGRRARSAKGRRFSSHWETPPRWHNECKSKGVVRSFARGRFRGRSPVSAPGVARQPQAGGGGRTLRRRRSNLISERKRGIRRSRKISFSGRYAVGPENAAKNGIRRV